MACIRCSEKKELNPFPLHLKWAAAAFINGQTLICGGATDDYVDCDQIAEKSEICQRNIECVQTPGGSKWCTGPKTANCYTYDPILTRDWSLVTKLKTARANAAATVSMDDVFWIFGGAGKSKILTSCEKLTLTSG